VAAVIADFGRVISEVGASMMMDSNKYLNRINYTNSLAGILYPV
jgi:ABC-type tungstate transport system substrate-binding protein